MATITLITSNVSFGGSGSTPPYSFDFDPQDRINLMKQPGAHRTETIRIIVRIDKAGVPLPLPPEAPEIHATALIAVDAYGNQLRGETNIAILPCPPYCGGGA